MTWNRPTPRPAAAATLLLAAAAACGGDGGGEADAAASLETVPGLESVPSPAGPGSAEPNLFAGPGGVFLSWLEPAAPGRHALRFARWDGTGWSEPSTVIERDSLFVNWADFPSLVALDDGTLVAHWLQKSGPAPYAYDVRTALSRDGGATWSDERVLHGDGLQAEHGFVSMLPMGDSVGVVWLDGRATPRGEPMTLRFSTLAADGGQGPEVLLDDATCDCCQTAAALADAGPVVAWRDRSPAEVRDIHLARRVDGRWTPGRPVHRDGWTIAACPVNGPALLADGRRVAVAWFTAADGAPGHVRVAFSRDGGATFGAPVPADDGSPIGRVALAPLDHDAVLLAWLEAAGASGEIRLRRVGDDGAGPSTLLAATDAARASGFPRLARAGDRILFAWTRPATGDAPDDDARVLTAVAPASAFAAP